MGGATVEMLEPNGTSMDVPITAEPGLSVELILEAPSFKDWVCQINKDPKLAIRQIHIQSLDAFGPRLGFVKFRTHAQVRSFRGSGVSNLFVEFAGA